MYMQTFADCQLASYVGSLFARKLGTQVATTTFQVPACVVLQSEEPASKAYRALCFFFISIYIQHYCFTCQFVFSPVSLFPIFVLIVSYA